MNTTEQSKVPSPQQELTIPKFIVKTQCTFTPPPDKEKERDQGEAK